MRRCKRCEAPSVNGEGTGPKWINVMSAICKLPKKNPAETVISKRPDARNGCLSHSISHRSFPFSTPARASRACHAMSQRRFPFSTTVAAASLPVCAVFPLPLLLPLASTAAVTPTTTIKTSLCSTVLFVLVCQTVSRLSIYLFITAFLIF